uniref:Uncharacterized protein n=1 Tax=Xenopus tropicalis TaxID=8364 RepID=A0A1B8Y4T4_XENTR
MGMSASSRQYYEYRYGKISWWIPPDRDIFEIRDFEDPRAGPYLECIRDQIRGDIRMALYDLWMARDCVKITKWWQFRLKADFRGDYRYIKAHLKDLYKDLEAINKVALGTKRQNVIPPAVPALPSTVIPPAVPALPSTVIPPAVPALPSAVIPPAVPALPSTVIPPAVPLKVLGKNCIPFPSIPQTAGAGTAGAGVCRLPGAQWNGVYATIFPCFPHPASLDYGKQGEGIDSGSKSDCR